MDSQTLVDWTQFTELTAEMTHRRWLFRGQASADWALEPSLQRAFDGVKALCKAADEKRRFDPVAYERNLVEEFSAGAHLFTDQLPQAGDHDLEWLALMQHHGTPTRLLDVSCSPWVALWFALESGTGDASIDAFDADAIISANTKADIDPRMLIFGKAHRTQRLLVYEPSRSSRRLMAQQGLFLVPTRINTPFSTALAHYPDCQKRWIIPAHLRLEGLRRLRSMNIGGHTLFPGLDGFARQLRFQPLEQAKRSKRLS